MWVRARLCVCVGIVCIACPDPPHGETETVEAYGNLRGSAGIENAAGAVRAVRGQVPTPGDLSL